MSTISLFAKFFNCRQWLKNFLIFVPAFFASSAWTNDLILNLSIAFFSFSLLASAIYLINDLRDLKSDQNHPTKRFRLIPSGKLSTTNAKIAIVLLILTSSALGLFVDERILYLEAIYLSLNILYSFGLKKIPVLDILVLIVGYIIRLEIGASIANVPLSPWVLSLVSLLAAFLILIKRQSEVELYAETTHKEINPKIDFYRKMNIPLTLSIFSLIIFLLYFAYIIVVFGSHPQFLYPILTIPVVGVILYRYNITLRKNIHRDPLVNFLVDPICLSGVANCLFLFIFTLYLT